MNLKRYVNKVIVTDLFLEKLACSFSMMSKEESLRITSYPFH